MQRRDIIVIGASAGGVEALQKLASELPAGFPAALFVVVHFPPYGTSLLPNILDRAGPLRAVHATDGQAVEPGTICAAPPDRHLLLERGVVRLVRGPRENGHRPAADPLFRTAARSYGWRVIGVVLTGNLDDGTAGLAAVKRRGGVAVVQDPADAQHAGMPSSALANVPVDHVCRLDDLAAKLVELVSEDVAPREGGMKNDELEFEADIAEMEPYALHADDRPGTPSGFSCPECHGVLWEIREGELVRFRCRVGHAFGAETLLAEQGSAVEAALWTAFQALRERAAFARRMARRMGERGSSISQERFAAQAADADARAEVIEGVLREAGKPGAAVADGQLAVRAEGDA